MAEDLVKLRGDWHAETLANGRTIAPGEPFPRSDLDEDGDARLIGEGLIIDAIVTPAPLEGDALIDRARELNIKGRTSMSADDLRAAVGLAESQRTTTATADERQPIVGN